jgi:2,3-dihydroxybenzoate decarboxylase/5-carboxyvanillate decarboxylase
MEINRRSLLSGATAGAAAGIAASVSTPALALPKNQLRIGTEEAFSTKEHIAAMKKLVDDNPQVTRWDYKLWRMMTSNLLADTPARLLDLEGVRLKEMDEYGVTMHLLSLTSPGVQLLDRDTAVGLATSTNDELAEVIARHPKRFAGLAAVAPQDPVAAAKEIERAKTKLKLNGVIINSHTNNEYLDDKKFWPIFEAAEANDMPIYIHPRTPSDQMRAPFDDYNMGSAFWGYGMETSTHFVRIMMSGALDRFPKLQIVLGHMGEAVHFWIWRLDYMSRAGRQRGETPAKKLPSEYMRRNLKITTSGQENPDALRYSIDTLGVWNVMWAIDYPYQETPGAVYFMDNAPLTQPERDAIYWQNAKRVFNITTV